MIAASLRCSRATLRFPSCALPKPKARVATERLQWHGGLATPHHRAISGVSREAPDKFRVFQIVQAVARRRGRCGPASPCGSPPAICAQADGRRISAPYGIGDDQPRLVRKNLRRHMRPGGEIEMIGVEAIVLPLRVGAKILDRRFDLHDRDHPVAGKRHEIGAAAGAERHLRDERQPLGAKPPADAAADGERALRLPPVDGKRRARSSSRLAWVRMRIAHATKLGFGRSY